MNTRLYQKKKILSSQLFSDTKKEKTATLVMN